MLCSLPAQVRGETRGEKSSVTLSFPLPICWWPKEIERKSKLIQSFCHEPLLSFLAGRNKAIADYLQSQGHLEALEAFKREAEIPGEGRPFHADDGVIIKFFG